MENIRSPQNNIKLSRMQWCLFACIIVCAIFFRFSNITAQGFLFWDEGTYMNEAKFYTSIVHNTPFILKQISHGFDLEEFQQVIDGWPPSAIKPLHGFIIFLFSLFIGLGAYTCQIVSAVFGIMLLGIVFFLVAKHHSSHCAVLTLFILAFSPYQIFLSRSGFPEMDALFFYMLSLAFYLHSLQALHRKKTYYFLAGIFFGFALATNLRLFMFIPVFFLFELLQCWRGNKNTLSNAFKRILCVAGGTVVMILLIDSPYLLVDKDIALPVNFRGFCEQFVHYFKSFVFKPSSSDASLLTFRTLYLKLYLHFSGYMHSIFLLLGTVWLLRGKKNAFVKISLITFYVILLGVSVVDKGYFARYDSMIYPFGAFLGACGILGFLNFLKSPRLRAFALSLIVLGIGIPSIVASEKFLTVSSGYDKAMDWLAEHDGAEHLSTTNSVSEFYFGRNVAKLLSRNEQIVLKYLTENDYKYLVLDYAYSNIRARRPSSLFDYLRDHCTPLVVIPNPMGKHLEFVLENLNYLEHPGNKYTELMNDPHTSEIRIYSTDGLVERLLQKRK